MIAAIIISLSIGAVIGFVWGGILASARSRDDYLQGRLDERYDARRSDATQSGWPV